MSNIIIDIAAQFTGKKAFTDADRAAARLNKNVKNLASTFGVAFSAQAFVNYSKNAVKAFAEDDKAARTLTKTLDNLGLAFADADIKTFISDLEKQFGVLDDELRPAYQKLITSTGDWRKSQELLKLSLDLSAQSGESVVTTANDLSQALVGNLKGLKKYNLGLTNAQLAALSFEEVLARLTKISKGQAALAADTYSGKLDKLKVAAANAQEVLGGALLDSFINLSGGDVDKATSKIETFSTTVAKLTRLLTGADSLSEALNAVDYKYGFIPTERKVSTNRSASPAGTYLRNQAEIKAAAAAKKLADEQVKATKELTKLTKDQVKLAKAKAIFDLQKIQIEAALKGKISEEERIRLYLLKAIAEENIEDIEKYTDLLNKVQGKVTELQDTLAEVYAMDAGNPFIAWEIGLDGVQRALIEINGQSIELTNTLAQNSLAMGLLGGASFAQALSGSRYAAQAAASMGITGTISGLPPVTAPTAPTAPTTVVNVKVEGTVTSQNDLQQAIQDAINAGGVSGNQFITGQPDRNVAI